MKTAKDRRAGARDRAGRRSGSLAVIVGHIRAIAAAKRGSSLSLSVMGKPVAKRVIPEIVQPQSLSLEPVGVPEEWQLIAVAEDKVVSDVELRKRPAIVGIERVDRVTEARGVIERLGPCVGRQKAEVSDLLLQAGLQGVVVGIGDRGFPGVAGEIKLAIGQFAAGGHGIGPRPIDDDTVSQIVNWSSPNGPHSSPGAISGGRQPGIWRHCLDSPLSGRKQMTAPRCHKADRKHGTLANLALNGEVKVLRIRKLVAGLEGGRT